jgi:hypothetical protein
MPACRFPPPWSVEELDACLVVIDSAGRGVVTTRSLSVTTYAVAASVHAVNDGKVNDS